MNLYMRIKNTINAGLVYLKQEWIKKLFFAILLKIQNPRARFIHYIHGEGIEIGALQNPLPVPSKQATVKYVDYKTTEELRRSYPELKSLNLVHIDYIGSAEDLSNISSDSQDFVILNHVFEHLINPIKSLSEFSRVLKKWWIVYLTVPEKTRTFDSNRPRTLLEHMIEDYQNPSSERDYQHFREFAWIRYSNPEDIENEAKRLFDENYSIHYHVFIEEDVVNLITWANQHWVTNLTIKDHKSLLKNPADIEFILILEKN